MQKLKSHTLHTISIRFLPSLYFLLHKLRHGYTANTYVIRETALDRIEFESDIWVGLGAIRNLTSFGYVLTSVSTTRSLDSSQQALRILQHGGGR